MRSFDFMILQRCLEIKSSKKESLPSTLACLFQGQEQQIGSYLAMVFVMQIETVLRTKQLRTP
jgi:hypothetical protein